MIPKVREISSSGPPIPIQFPIQINILCYANCEAVKYFLWSAHQRILGTTAFKFILVVKLWYNGLLYQSMENENDLDCNFSHTEIFSKRRKIYAIWVRDLRILHSNVRRRPIILIVKPTLKFYKCQQQKIKYFANNFKLAKQTHSQ